MWVFLSDAFLSIVAHRNEADKLLVRARVGGDIERVFPEAHVERTPNADYLYRAVIDRTEVGAALARSAESIAYDNFKNSIRDPDRHTAAMNVWGAVRELQR